MKAITVENVSKFFRIPIEKRSTVYENIAGVLKGQHYNYEEFWALKDINFSVKKGEFIGIIGENGSGKTTLLNIIANIMRPTKGGIVVNGKITSFLELGVGFQPEMTAKENIYLYGAIMGLSDREIDERIGEIFEFSGLKKFEDTKLKNFSSGMQVRLAFSTAIQTNPEIMLVDEVLAVGDMEFKQKCFDKFNEFKRSGITILFVTHDLGSVRQFCDKTLLLRHGEQVAFGNTNEIIDAYVYGKPKGARLDEISEEDWSELTKKRLRWGTKDVEIVDVVLLDKFNQSNNVFQSGDPLTVKMEYVVKDVVKNPVFGVEIYDEKDNYCFGANTKLRNLKIDEIRGKGEMTLDIKSLPFLNGKYYVTTAVHSYDGKINYDWHNKLYSFNVVNSTKDVGFVAVDCEYKLNNQKLKSR